MHLIDAETAEAYLRSTGRAGPDERLRVRRLSGGVSNEVLYVERRDAPGGDFVLKQARPQLRVPDPWYCSVERIWREVETLRVCSRVLGAVSQQAADGRTFAVPGLLFEDRENYLFAMSAAPPHEVWKQRLLAGRVEPEIAAACGRMLAALHAGTWRDAQLAGPLGDRSFFDDLRIDPYYRRVAEVHPDLQPAIAALIDSLEANCLCLVHGDFSPKNLLVDEAGGVTLVDFEVGHLGDPAFDLGFFLSHLTLKAFWSGPRFGEYLTLTDAFWRTYREGMSDAAADDELRDLTARAVRNFAGCLLARIDGKSRVEYLTDESLRDGVRRCARSLLLDTPATWEGVEELLSRHALASGFVPEVPRLRRTGDENRGLAPGG
jgi:5-methylthioribose kinase